MNIMVWCVHATQINAWKKREPKELPELCGQAGQRDQQVQKDEKNGLYQHIGKLQEEVDWLKKSIKLGMG